MGIVISLAAMACCCYLLVERDGAAAAKHRHRSIVRGVLCVRYRGQKIT